MWLVEIDTRSPFGSIAILLCHFFLRVHSICHLATTLKRCNTGLTRWLRNPM